MIRCAGHAANYRPTRRTCRRRVSFSVVFYYRISCASSPGRYLIRCCIENIEKRPLFGDCDFERISTSHVERHNLTIRMNNRRFTRLTNADSKSHKHHVAMQAIFFAWYNFCRKHETLKGKTPAMASGIADIVLTLSQLIEAASLA